MMFRDWRIIGRWRNGCAFLLAMGCDQEDAEYYVPEQLVAMGSDGRKDLLEVWLERWHGTPGRGRWVMQDAVIRLGRWKQRAANIEFHRGRRLSRVNHVMVN